MVKLKPDNELDRVRDCDNITKSLLQYYYNYTTRQPTITITIITIIY